MHLTGTDASSSSIIQTIFKDPKEQKGYSCKSKLSVTVGKDNKFVIGNNERKRHFS
jgi:hypothetical protein